MHRHRVLAARSPPVSFHKVPAGGVRAGRSTSFRKSGSVNSMRKNSAAIDSGRPSMALPVIMRLAGSVVFQHQASAGTWARIVSRARRLTTSRSASASPNRSMWAAREVPLAKETTGQSTNLLVSTLRLEGRRVAWAYQWRGDPL
jgi:hypothetical protein